MNDQGVLAGNELAVIALGEPLWTKLSAGKASRASPFGRSGSATQLDGSGAHRDDAFSGGPGPLASAPGDRLALSTPPSDGSLPRVATAEARPEDAAHSMVFDFKMGSPSADFYAKQSAKHAKAKVVQFEPAYSRVPASSLKSPSSPSKLPALHTGAGDKSPSLRKSASGGLRSPAAASAGASHTPGAASASKLPKV